MEVLLNYHSHSGTTIPGVFEFEHLPRVGEFVIIEGLEEPDHCNPEHVVTSVTHRYDRKKKAFIAEVTLTDTHGLDDLPELQPPGWKVHSRPVHSR